MIDQEDAISRCIIFPKAFKNKHHVNEYLFVFGQSGADGASHESAVLRSLAPEDDEVHRIGCKIAMGQNERKKPLNDKRYYCGFRTARVGDVAVKGDGFELQIKLQEEHGEPAHIDISLVVHSSSKNERNNIKTEVALQMAEAFGPAVEHVCGYDLNDGNHPLILDPDCLSRVIRPVSEYYT